MDEQARHGSPSAEIEVRRTPPRELPPPTSIGGRPLIEGSAPRVGGTQPPPTGAIGHSPLVGTPMPTASSSISPEFKSYVRDKTTLRFPCLLLGPDGRVSINPVLQSGTLQNTTLQRQYGDVALVKVQLPPRKAGAGDVAAMLKKPVEWEGKQYRLDLFDTGDADQAWGVSTEDAAKIAQVPADEWNEYARQGLFSEAVTGAAGRFQICLAPMGTSFAVKGGAALQVNDGFGFIRESLAKTMGVTAKGVEGDKKGSIPATERSLDKPAHPNTQMLQWLKEDNAVVAELVNQAVNNLERQLGPRAQPPSGEDLYRAATTGDFKVRYGTAVPVPGKNVVLSIESTDGDPRVALHRSPADKPNWTQGAVEPSSSALAKSIRELTAFQYRLQQKPAPERPMLMMKGLLGVIPDDAWPEAYAGHQIVGCVTDCKVDTAWTSEADVNSAKSAEIPRELALDGNLAVTQIFGPGSLVGVPAPMMKQLSGDYDGDAVHVLRASDCPMLFSRLGALDQRMNPKLTKHIVMHGEDEADDGPRSMATRLAEIRDADAIVGTWSTVADILCTIHPDQLGTVRPRIAAIAGLGLPDDAALWELVGLGIKVGTDLPKTNLSKLEFRGTRLEAVPLRKAGSAINRYLRSRGHDNPHARKHKDAIVGDLTAGRPMAVRADQAPAHYGVPGRIMRAVNEYLRIKWEQSVGYAGPLSPLFAPNEPTKQRARQLFTDGRDADVRTADDIDAAARELIGKLVGLFDKDTRTTARNRDADRWMLQALSVVQPSRLQARYARLASLSGDLAEAEADKILGEIVDELAHNFAQFIGSARIRRGAVLPGLVVNEHASGVFVDLMTGAGINGLIRGAKFGPRLAPNLHVSVRVTNVRSTADKDLVDLALA